MVDIRSRINRLKLLKKSSIKLSDEICVYIDGKVDESYIEDVYIEMKGKLYSVRELCRVEEMKEVKVYVYEDYLKISVCDNNYNNKYLVINDKDGIKEHKYYSDYTDVILSVTDGSMNFRYFKDSDTYKIDISNIDISDIKSEYIKRTVNPYVFKVGRYLVDVRDKRVERFKRLRYFTKWECKCFEEIVIIEQTCGKFLIYDVVRGREVDSYFVSIDEATKEITNKGYRTDILGAKGIKKYENAFILNKRSRYE